MYLSGFLDAEAALMIVKSTSGDPPRTQYRARIAVGNTDRSVLEDMRRDYGGILVDQPPQESRWKNAYQLVWTDGMVGRTLSLVSPHLRVKHLQARILAEFMRHKTSTKQGHSGRHFAALPAEVVEIREMLYQRVKVLNLRGDVPRT